MLRRIKNRIRSAWIDFLYWLTGEHPLADEDTCMCGSPVDGHNIGSGHSPVSVRSYYWKPPVWERVMGRNKWWEDFPHG